MKLTNILREMGEDENTSSERESKNVVLTTKATPISDVENALNDLSNYGMYASYAQNTDIDVRKLKDAWFGPSGVGPNTKAKITRIAWNEATPAWRKLKLSDIKSRHPELNVTGLEDMRFEELPKEVSDPRVYFITPYTKDKLDDLIKSLSKNSNILDWYEENGTIIFPRTTNKNIPGDVTIEKVIKTVMKNAGITDVIVRKEYDDGEGGTITKTISKSTQLKIPVESRGDASNLRKELQAKFVIPSAGYKIKEDKDGVYLLITNITIQQKANITFYLEDKGLMEGMSEDFRRLQVLAGIIK